MGREEWRGRTPQTKCWSPPLKLTGKGRKKLNGIFLYTCGECALKVTQQPENGLQLLQRRQLEYEQRWRINQVFTKLENLKGLQL